MSIFSIPGRGFLPVSKVTTELWMELGFNADILRVVDIWFIVMIAAFSKHAWSNVGHATNTCKQKRRELQFLAVIYTAVKLESHVVLARASCSGIRCVGKYRKQLLHGPSQDQFSFHGSWAEAPSFDFDSALQVQTHPRRVFDSCSLSPATLSHCTFPFRLFPRFQFYCWYYHTLPFLLWQTDIPVVGRLLLLAGLEYSFNIFPATPTSSLVLQVLCTAPRWSNRDEDLRAWTNLHGSNGMCWFRRRKCTSSNMSWVVRIPWRKTAPGVPVIGKRL